MAPDTHADDQLYQTATRRNLLAGVGGLLAGGGAGVLLFREASGQAAAAVSLGAMQVSGASASPTDGAIEAVTATVSGQWDYDLSDAGLGDSRKPAAWEIALRVGDGDGAWATVDTAGGGLDYWMMSDSYSVSGAITATELWAPAAFAAGTPGETREVALPLRIVFSVFDGDDRAVARAQVEDTATVSVTNAGITATDYGAVSAEGGLSVTA